MKTFTADVPSKCFYIIVFSKRTDQSVPEQFYLLIYLIISGSIIQNPEFPQLLLIYSNSIHRPR